MVLEGPDVIKRGHVMAGTITPLAAPPGTIRGNLCLSVSRNIAHGSDSPDNAKNEIGL